MYSFPRTLEFYIDGHLFPVKFASFNSKLEISSEMNYLVNSRAFYALDNHDKEFKSLNDMLDKEEEMNKLIVWEDVAKSPITYISVTSFIGIIVLMLLAFFLIKRLIKSRTLARLRARHAIRMSDLVGNR